MPKVFRGEDPESKPGNVISRTQANAQIASALRDISREEIKTTPDREEKKALRQEGRRESVTIATEIVRDWAETFEWIPVLGHLLKTKEYDMEMLAALLKSGEYGEELSTKEAAKQFISKWGHKQWEGIKATVALIFLVGLPEMVVAKGATSAAKAAQIGSKAARVAITAKEAYGIYHDVNSVKEALSGMKEKDWLASLELAPVVFHQLAHNSQGVKKVFLTLIAQALSKLSPEEILPWFSKVDNNDVARDIYQGFSQEDQPLAQAA